MWQPVAFKGGRHILIANRIALDPTNKQRTIFARAAGTTRFAYNWALSEWKAQYQAQKSDPSLPAPSEPSLRKKLNSLKRENFRRMFDVTKCAVQEACDLGSAFADFLKKRAKYPKSNEKALMTFTGQDGVALVQDATCA